jgi:hypothetical protein
VGQERIGPSYFFMSLVLGPLNSLLWYVPSSRYILSLAPILFLQEQIKDIIIMQDVAHPQPSTTSLYSVCIRDACTLHAAQCAMHTV